MPMICFYHCKVATFLLCDNFNIQCLVHNFESIKGMKSIKKEKKRKKKYWQTKSKKVVHIAISKVAKTLMPQLLWFVVYTLCSLLSIFLHVSCLSLHPSWNVVRNHWSHHWYATTQPNKSKINVICLTSSFFNSINVLNGNP